MPVTRCLNISSRWGDAEYYPVTAFEWPTYSFWSMGNIQWIYVAIFSAPSINTQLGAYNGLESRFIIFAFLVRLRNPFAKVNPYAYKLSDERVRKRRSISIGLGIWSMILENIAKLKNIFATIYRFAYKPLDETKEISGRLLLDGKFASWTLQI